MDRPRAVTISVLASAAACAAGMINLFATKGPNASFITLGVWAFAHGWFFSTCGQFGAAADGCGGYSYFLALTVSSLFLG